jgi:imidazolonepropionase
MPVLTNIATLATCRAGGGQGEIHALSRAALVWQGRTVSWVGPESELPATYRTEETWNAGGRLVVPGLVDCHTHLAFGGWRADEFEQRIRGRTYLEIARAGGGISATVALTRAQSEAALLERAMGFAREMLALGVTAIECKSGYGLTLESELRLLRVYQRLGQALPVRIVATLLGAHIIPEEYAAQRAAYVELVTREMIPRVGREGLARFCDVFVEEGAFSRDEARAILQAGRKQGLAAKVHADQLSSSGGAALAAEVGAASADHLECVSEEGIRALATAGCVAVSLPLASLFLQGPPMPARRLIEAGVPVAVATDFNPGSAPSWHLPLAMLLACTLQRMTPAEVLKGATLYAARAIGLESLAGSLEPGKAADFALIEAETVNHWLYHFRPNACCLTVVDGNVVWRGAGVEL